MRKFFYFKPPVPLWRMSTYPPTPDRRLNDTFLAMRLDASEEPENLNLVCRFRSPEPGLLPPPYENAVGLKTNMARHNRGVSFVFEFPSRLLFVSRSRRRDTVEVVKSEARIWEMLFLVSGILDPLPFSVWHHSSRRSFAEMPSLLISINHAVENNAGVTCRATQHNVDGSF